MYNCGCDDCKHKSEQLNLSISNSFKNVLNAGKTAYKRLHEIGSYKPQDLKTEKAYQDLINQTFDVFNFAITDNDMPSEMRIALQSDAFLFGGLKTHAQLFEASKLLLDDNGKLKPFQQLSNEFDKLNVSYNKTYLESEYEFAVSSSQMAAKWSTFGTNNRYYLQYRTAGDTRVRQEHANLNGTTLPESDAFWSSYTPPNGWNCRCTLVEVLKDKYPVSNSEESITKGEAATTQIGKDGKNRLAIFRFNPGADKKLLPPLHPNNMIAGAKVATPIINEMFTNANAALRKAKDAEIKEWAKANIPETAKIVNLKNFKTGQVKISRGSIKSIGDHFSAPELKEVAKNIISNLKNCKHLGTAPLDPNSKNYQKKVLQGVTNFHYYEFEWKKQLFRLNTEEINGKFEKPYSANLIIKK
ncbi:phage head morphogenesis protein [Flavobacterium sp. N1994]|uniref:phage head morphogenesis protein n=1 Tax=Flavobacterium sp. N1994 TaxID=2986827 RepID=UPI0022215B48|nr:phage head morphogenesis protein [Flavobacterium sp. N1994]